MCVIRVKVVISNYPRCIHQQRQRIRRAEKDVDDHPGADRATGQPKKLVTWSYCQPFKDPGFGALYIIIYAVFIINK